MIATTENLLFSLTLYVMPVNHSNRVRFTSANLLNLIISYKYINLELLVNLFTSSQYIIMSCQVFFRADKNVYSAIKLLTLMMIIVIKIL